MNSVPQQPLPQLSPEDQSLLTAYFATNEDLYVLLKNDPNPAIQASPPHTILSLLQWLSRPEIAAYIQAYRTHQTQLHRNTIIAALNSALKATTDPIEIRRAATTLLRALNPIRSSLGGGGFPTRPTSDSKSHRHPPAVRSATYSQPAPSHLRPTSPLSTPNSPPSTTSPSPTHPFTLSPPHPSPRPTLSEALAILGIPELTDEEEDALEDAELDALDDEDDQGLADADINSS